MLSTACSEFLGNAAVNRRELLRAGALSLLGLSLPELLRAQTANSRPRAKACILLFMWGGPAQQDTWDLKPAAPIEYRGEFRPIATTVPGLHICEHLPRLARRAHQLSLIRSMTHDNVDHLSAPHLLLTGKPTPRNGQLADDWPSIGAVLARQHRGRGPLPPFVSMMPVVPNGAPRFVEQTHGQGAGWFGPVYNPMRIDADASLPGYRVGDFDLRADLDALRTGGRQQLLRAIDHQVRRLEDHPHLQAMQSQYDRAFSLLAAPEVTRAFNVAQEPRGVRERYGLNIHGQSVLQARRLVEAGVPIVTIFWPNDGITNVSVYWDTHNRNFIDLRERLCPVTDRAFSALLDDLDQRGLLDETLVVWTGEMGRTPRVGQSVVGGAGAGRDGRDHWGKVFTSVLAGGGVRGGMVYGASDRYAAEPAELPTPPQDLTATIYHLLGIDPRMEIHDRLGRPLTLCDGQIIRPILR